MSNVPSSFDSDRATCTHASRLLLLGASTCVQFAPPSVDAKSFWPTLAWKNVEAPFHQGAAKPCVGGVWPLSGLLDAGTQLPLPSRCQSARSPTATPDVRLITSTECTRFVKVAPPCAPGSG